MPITIPSQCRIATYGGSEVSRSRHGDLKTTSLRPHAAAHMLQVGCGYPAGGPAQGDEVPHLVFRHRDSSGSLEGSPATCFEGFRKPQRPWKPFMFGAPSRQVMRMNHHHFLRDYNVRKQCISQVDCCMLGIFTAVVLTLAARAHPKATVGKPQIFGVHHCNGPR